MAVAVLARTITPMIMLTIMLTIMPTIMHTPIPIPILANITIVRRGTNVVAAADKTSILCETYGVGLTDRGHGSPRQTEVTADVDL